MKFSDLSQHTNILRLLQANQFVYNQEMRLSTIKSQKQTDYQLLRNKWWPQISFSFVFARRSLTNNIRIASIKKYCQLFPQTAVRLPVIYCHKEENKFVLICIWKDFKCCQKRESKNEFKKIFSMSRNTLPSIKGCVSADFSLDFEFVFKFHCLWMNFILL